MGKQKKRNELFDINKFPAEEGILVFGISLPKIGNTQSAKECFKSLKYLTNKIVKPMVGANFIYADNLYLYSDEKASNLKNKHLTLIASHKFNFLNILNKNKWFIRKSISFVTWNQLILESKEFNDYFARIQHIYKNDKTFKKYVNDDITSSKKIISKNNVLFILEELLVFYLTRKGKIRLLNDYIQDKEKWILWCYPGKPLNSEIYMHQKNFFKLMNSKNKYEHSCYDLEGKKLYNFDDIDLENIKFFTGSSNRQ